MFSSLGYATSDQQAARTHNGYGLSLHARLIRNGRLARVPDAGDRIRLGLLHWFHEVQAAVAANTSASMATPARLDLATTD